MWCCSQVSDGFQKEVDVVSIPVARFGCLSLALGGGPGIPGMFFFPPRKGSQGYPLRGAVACAGLRVLSSPGGTQAHPALGACPHCRLGSKQREVLA